MYRGTYNGSGTAGVDVNVDIDGDASDDATRARSRLFTLSFEGAGNITVTAIMQDATVAQPLDNNVIAVDSGIYEFSAAVKTIVLNGTGSYDFFINAAED